MPPNSIFSAEKGAEPLDGGGFDRRRLHGKARPFVRGRCRGRGRHSRPVLRATDGLFGAGRTCACFQGYPFSPWLQGNQKETHHFGGSNPVGLFSGKQKFRSKPLVVLLKWSRCHMTALWSHWWCGELSSKPLATSKPVG